MQSRKRADTALHRDFLIDRVERYTTEQKMNFEDQAHLFPASNMPEKSSLEKDQRSTAEESTTSATSATQDAAKPLEKVTSDFPHTTYTTASPAASSTLQRVDTRPDGSEYPSGLKLYLITLALCLAVFLMALDNSIIATAIPHITDEFLSLDDVGWYGSGEHIVSNSNTCLWLGTNS